MEGDEAELLQLGLTEKALRTVGRDGCNPGLTPAKESPLTTDLDGEPFDEDWEHASVVGMPQCCCLPVNFLHSIMLLPGCLHLARDHHLAR